MKDKIMSFQELDNYRRNLNMLEIRLGNEVPQYLLNGNDMSKKIMSLTEIDTMARNIEMINMMSGKSGYNRPGIKRTWIDYLPIYTFIFVIVGSLIVHFLDL